MPYGLLQSLLTSSRARGLGSQPAAALSLNSTAEVWCQVCL
jgi:hypothetical protein